jgi:hypothetical protein
MFMKLTTRLKLSFSRKHVQPSQFYNTLIHLMGNDIEEKLQVLTITLQDGTLIKYLKHNPIKT